MSDKPSREAEQAVLADTYADTGTGSVSEPTIPIADKGEVARAARDDSAPADGPGTTPRPRSDRAEELAGADGLIEPRPELEPLDFTDGDMPTQTVTQGESVIDAAFADRGPATHLNPTGMGRLVEPSAAEVLDQVAGDALPGDMTDDPMDIDRSPTEPAEPYQDEEEI